jgi:hypothetical protein
MSVPVKTREELTALFRSRATAPPPKESELLLRHLQCKESPTLARIVSEAMARHAEAGSQPLPVPTELLPPLA